MAIISVKFPAVLLRIAAMVAFQAEPIGLKNAAGGGINLPTWGRLAGLKVLTVIGLFAAV